MRNRLKIFTALSGLFFFLNMPALADDSDKGDKDIVFKALKDEMQRSTSRLHGPV